VHNSAMLVKPLTSTIRANIQICFGTADLERAVVMYWYSIKVKVTCAGQVW